METFGIMGFMIVAMSMSYATAALSKIKKLEKRSDDLESANANFRSQWKIESDKRLE